MPELPKLSLAEWIVLCLLDESPRHGFAVAGLTAPDGELGRVWHLPRPIVYRAAARLIELELVRKEGTEPGRAVRSDRCSPRRPPARPPCAGG